MCQQQYIIGVDNTSTVLSTQMTIMTTKMTVPRTHNRFGDRSFAVAGPRLRNSFPISLRQISSYGQFRRYLKKNIYLEFEKSQRSVTHDSLRYIDILTYLLT